MPGPISFTALRAPSDAAGDDGLDDEAAFVASCEKPSRPQQIPINSKDALQTKFAMTL
jgi:hypothetical protein